MEELNQLRTKIKKRIIRVRVISTVLFLVWIINFIRSPMINSPKASDMLVTITFLYIVLPRIVLIFYTSRPKAEYAKIFKETFVLKALKEIFSNVIYEPNSGIPYDTIAKTNMMNMGDKYYSEDYIDAKYKDIKFKQADVHIQEEHRSTDSKGNTHTHYVTIFRGRWMIFDFNKEFKANVQISQKGFTNSRVNVFWGKKENRFKKVSMESETFNKKFNVYAQNEHDAFYIITPSLMERIERLENENKGKLLFCFIDNKLHIGIYDNKNAFEPGSVFKEIDEEKMKEKTLSEIRTITSFVDELNLDNNLFKKEE